MYGTGSLAHEWLHAFDHYFARLNNDGKGGGYISEAKTRGAAREPVWQAWKAIEKSIAKGTFAKRSDELDAARSKAYYGTTIEKAARAFERYIVDRLAEFGVTGIGTDIILTEIEGTDGFGHARTIAGGGVMLTVVLQHRQYLFRRPHRPGTRAR